MAVWAGGAAVLVGIALAAWLGRGSSTTEQAGFGIDDPDLTKEMFDEVVGQFRHMWSDGEYGYDGKFFSMPPPRE